MTDKAIQHSTNRAHPAIDTAQAKQIDSESTYQVVRSAGRLVIVDKEGKAEKLTPDVVHVIANKASGKSLTIRTKGISRIVAGEIAGDLRSTGRGSVTVHRSAKSSQKANSHMEFVIRMRK